MIGFEYAKWHGRDAAAAQALCQFVEDMKSSGFVAQALARHGVQGASVAPVAEQPA